MSQSVTLTLPDMTCSNCVFHVREALAGLPGVTVRQIDLRTHQVHIEVADQAALSAAEARLAEGGYPPRFGG